MGNSRRAINKSSVLFVIATVLIFWLNVPTGSADIKDEAKVLVIYTSRDGEIDEYQRSLDMLISHFTNDVTFISSEEVEKNDLRNVTHLFYYGQVNARLPSTFVTLFDDYPSSTVAR